MATRSGGEKPSVGLAGETAADKLPRTFTYDAAKNRRAMWGMSGALGVLALSPILLWAAKSSAARFGPGWQWGLAAVGLMELLMILYAMVFATVVWDYKDAARRANERISVDTQGLTFEDGTRRVEAAWEDIRIWRVGRRKEGVAARSLYKIQTETDAFEFTRYITDAEILREVITLHVGRKPTLEEEADALESASPGIYTYRTRTNRAMLLLPTCVAALFLLPLLLPLFIEQDAPRTLSNKLFLILVSGGLWIGALVGWARYRTGRIEIDAEGITERRLFGVSRLAWQEVESYAMCKDSFMGHGELVGPPGRVRFGATIAHLDQLKAEISRQAIHSRNREWNDIQADGANENMRV